MLLFPNFPPDHYKIPFPLAHRGQDYPRPSAKQRKAEWKSIPTEDFLISQCCFTTVLSIASALALSLCDWCGNDHCCVSHVRVHDVCRREKKREQETAYASVCQS